jgi:uncharacterized membrane protein YvbJ
MKNRFGGILQKRGKNMKVCNNCGTTLNDNVTFCPNCGSNVPAGYPGYHRPAGQRAAQPVSVGGWIGRSLIPLIPLVGGIVYLIMLFIWSGDTTKEESFRNWAKAQLIVMAVVVVLTIIITVVFGVAVAEMLGL